MSGEPQHLPGDEKLKLPGKRYVVWLPIVLSGIAIILSQFQPLYTHFLEAEITMDVGTRVDMNQHMGRPAPVIFLQFTNMGSAPALVGDIRALLRKVGPKKVEWYFTGDEQVTLSALSQIASADGAGAGMASVPLNKLSIKPNETWESLVPMRHPDNLEDGPLEKELLARCARYYEANIYREPPPPALLEEPPPPALLERVNSFTPGDYLLYVTADLFGTDGESVQTLFRFTLHESTRSTFLLNAKNAPASGYCPPPPWVRLMPVTVYLRPISEDDTAVSMSDALEEIRERSK